MHLEHRWNLTPGLLTNKVSWKAFKKARANSPSPIQKFITKWLSESLPTGKVMVQRQQRIHAHCPFCEAPDEHLLHILCCPDPRASTFFTSELDKLISWLEKIKTHDAIIDFFENEIDNWRQHNMNYAAPTLHFYPVDAQLAFRKQLDIGWFLTLCGFLSPDLLQLQTHYYRSLGRRSSGVQWGQKCIRKLWDLVYNIWTFRNSILHENEIHNLHGLSKLTTAIREEFTLGASGLPPTYRQYFSGTVESLLSTTVSYQKQWFRQIRRAREKRHCHLQDEFDSDNALRRWVGLPLRIRSRRPRRRRGR